MKRSLSVAAAILASGASAMAASGTAAASAAPTGPAADDAGQTAHQGATRLIHTVGHVVRHPDAVAPRLQQRQLPQLADLSSQPSSRSRAQPSLPKLPLVEKAEGSAQHVKQSTDASLGKLTDTLTHSGPNSDATPQAKATPRQGGPAIDDLAGDNTPAQVLKPATGALRHVVNVRDDAAPEASGQPQEARHSAAQEPRERGAQPNELVEHLRGALQQPKSGVHVDTRAEPLDSALQSAGSVAADSLDHVVHREDNTIGSRHAKGPVNELANGKLVPSVIAHKPDVSLTVGTSPRATGEHARSPKFSDVQRAVRRYGTVHPDLNQQHPKTDGILPG